MLGTLSKHPEGLEYVRDITSARIFPDPVYRLMEKSKVFTAFYHLSELRNREDLITAVITNLDYTMYVFACFCPYNIQNVIPI